MTITHGTQKLTKLLVIDYRSPRKLDECAVSKFRFKLISKSKPEVIPLISLLLIRKRPDNDSIQIYTSFHIRRRMYLTVRAAGSEPARTIQDTADGEEEEGGGEEVSVRPANVAQMRAIGVGSKPHLIPMKLKRFRGS